MAGFSLQFPLQGGIFASISGSEFEHGSQPIQQKLNWWPLTITPLAASTPRRLAHPLGADSLELSPVAEDFSSAALPLALPRVECTLVAEIAAETDVFEPPPLAARVAAPAAQAVERMLFPVATLTHCAVPSHAAGLFANMVPAIGAFRPVALAGTIEGPRPQAAERMVHAGATAAWTSFETVPFDPGLELAPLIAATRDSIRLAPWMSPMPAEPAERWILTSTAVDWVTGTVCTPAVPALAIVPVFDALQAEPLLTSIRTAESIASAAAQPVERWIAASTATDWMAPAACAPIVPVLAIAPVFDALQVEAEPLLTSIRTAESMPAAAAQPVERWIAASLATEWVSPAASLPKVPVLAFDPVFGAFQAEPVAAPAAQPAERWIAASAATEWMAPIACAPMVPALAIDPVLDVLQAEPLLTSIRTAEPMPAASAEPVERLVAASADIGWMQAAITPVAPAFAVEAILAAPRQRREERWMPAGAAEAAASEVTASAADQSEGVPAARLPKVVPLPKQPTLPAAAAYRKVPAPGEVSVRVMPLSVAALQPQQQAPAIPALRALTGSIGFAGVAAGPQAAPLESMPGFAFQAMPLAAAPALRLPSLSLPEAGVEASGVPAAEAPPAAAAAIVSAFPPVIKLHVVRPEPVEMIAAQVPPAAFVSLDYHCVRRPGVPVPCLEWCTPEIEAIPPRMTVTPVFDRREEAPQRVAAKANFAEIFRMPEAQKRKRSSGMWVAAKALAACLMTGSVLWFGMGAIRIGNQTPAVNRDASLTYTASTPSDTSAGSNPDSPAAPAAAPSQGVIAKLRHTIANRAASTVTDSFSNGMEAWGTAAKSWAPGWSRSADGYVKTGQLALFRPSLGYADYRLEFFGQIESKSIGWAVRARDPKNYYAMEFTVVQPGLRPIIGIEHYPVVDGKRGKATAIPLNVMVHNNTPMQVAVDVRGNKLVTSVDGQEVDTWIDDTLPSGGVGFFSEAGARARLYWMKVSKNEDFLGRVCAYLSRNLGDGSTTTAELWNPAVPPPPAPQRVPERSTYALVPPQPQYEHSRRMQSWRS